MVTGRVPEEDEGQESYSRVIWVKLGDSRECDWAGVKLQGWLKLKMVAGS